MACVFSMKSESAAAAGWAIGLVSPQLVFRTFLLLKLYPLPREELSPKLWPTHKSDPSETMGQWAGKAFEAGFFASSPIASSKEIGPFLDKACPLYDT
jgi:hypothetical protein